MVGRVVDATDECDLGIDHHQLAVHAPEGIQAPAETAQGGLENAPAHARVKQGAQEIFVEVG